MLAPVCGSCSNKDQFDDKFDDNELRGCFAPRTRSNQRLNSLGLAEVSQQLRIIPLKFDDTDLAAASRSNQRLNSPRLAQVPTAAAGRQLGIIEHSLSAGCAAAQQLRIIEHNQRLNSLGLAEVSQQLRIIPLKQRLNSPRLAQVPQQPGIIKHGIIEHGIQEETHGYK